MAIAARMPMIRMTTRSSMSVEASLLGLNSLTELPEHVTTSL